LDIYGNNDEKVLILITAVMLPILASGQAQITTKKAKIADFPNKVTKVVMPGNAFYDGAFQEVISSRWRVSPFEFCSLNEFDKLKGSDQYYFMMLTQGQFKNENEPGLQFITLIKGGADAAKGIDSMLEVVTVPFAAADFPSGRELIYLPALIDIIQNYTMSSIEKDFSNLGGLSAYATNLTKANKMEIVFAEDDLSDEITEADKAAMAEKNISITDSEEVDALADGKGSNTLVSYTVAPEEPVAGSFCYKMLIDTNTHELYYFRKHKISKKLSKGFLSEDIKRITAFRPKNKQ
jgi:hypothetical protein